LTKLSTESFYGEQRVIDGFLNPFAAAQRGVMFEEIGADLGRRIDSYAQTNGGTGVLLVAVSSDGEIAGFLDVGLRRLSSTNRSFIPCSTDDLKATLDVPEGVLPLASLWKAFTSP
jgi:hypothetical protein